MSFTWLHDPQDGLLPVHLTFCQHCVIAIYLKNPKKKQNKTLSLLSETLIKELIIQVIQIGVLYILLYSRSVAYNRYKHLIWSNSWPRSKTDPDHTVKAWNMNSMQELRWKWKWNLGWNTFSEILKGKIRPIIAGVPLSSTWISSHGTCWLEVRGK